MKKTIIALLLLTIVSCNCGIKKDEDLDNVKVIYNTFGHKIIEIEEDGCQYLLYRNGNDGELLHKANCNNPIHKDKLNQ